VNEIGSFKYTGSIGFARNDYNVGEAVAFINNERPSGGPQNRMPSRKHRYADNRQ